MKLNDDFGELCRFYAYKLHKSPKLPMFMRILANESTDIEEIAPPAAEYVLVI